MALPGVLDEAMMDSALMLRRKYKKSEIRERICRANRRHLGFARQDKMRDIYVSDPSILLLCLSQSGCIARAFRGTGFKFRPPAAIHRYPDRLGKFISNEGSLRRLRLENRHWRAGSRDLVPGLFADLIRMGHTTPPLSPRIYFTVLSYSV